MSWYVRVLKKYAVFSGRARRKEYWYFVLFNLVFAFVLALNEAVPLLVRTGGVLGSLYSLAVLLPSIAVSVRRLHDTGRSGWWLFIGLIPLIGAIILLIFMVSDSQPGTNRYGPSPKLNVSEASGVANILYTPDAVTEERFLKEVAVFGARTMDKIGRNKHINQINVWAVGHISLEGQQIVKRVKLTLNKENWQGPPIGGLLNFAASDQQSYFRHCSLKDVSEGEIPEFE